MKKLTSSASIILLTYLASCSSPLEEQPVTNQEDETKVGKNVSPSRVYTRRDGTGFWIGDDFYAGLRIVSVSKKRHRTTVNRVHKQILPTKGIGRSICAG